MSCINSCDRDIAYLRTYSCSTGRVLSFGVENNRIELLYEEL